MTTISSVGAIKERNNDTEQEPAAQESNRLSGAASQVLSVKDTTRMSHVTASVLLMVDHTCVPSGACIYAEVRCRRSIHDKSKWWWSRRLIQAQHTSVCVGAFTRLATALMGTSMNPKFGTEW